MHTSAAPIGEPTATSDSATVAAKKSTKKSKKNKNNLKVALDEIEPVRKGLRDFEVTAHLSGAKKEIIYRCRLTVTYEDGTSQQPDDVVADNKMCTVSFDIPNDSEIVGNAEAELIVVNESGKKKGKAVQVFEIHADR
jgi:hypothetical protein